MYKKNKFLDSELLTISGICRACEIHNLGSHWAQIDRMNVKMKKKTVHGLIYWVAIWENIAIMAEVHVKHSAHT